MRGKKDPSMGWGGGDGERRMTFQTTQGTVFFKCLPRDVHPRAYLCIFHDKTKGKFPGENHVV